LFLDNTCGIVPGGVAAPRAAGVVPGAGAVDTNISGVVPGGGNVPGVLAIPGVAAPRAATANGAPIQRVFPKFFPEVSMNFLLVEVVM